MTSIEWKETNYLLLHLYTRVAAHGLHHWVCAPKVFHSPNEKNAYAPFAEDCATCITL
jgi:hypothetical protein